jgi:hypothetical protein
MANADGMVYITQCKLQQLVRQDTGRVRKAEKGMIREYSSETHGARMYDGLMAKAAETAVSMYNFNLFPYYNIPEHWKEGEYGWEGRFAEDHEEGNVVDFQAIGEVSDPSAPFVRVRYYYYFVATIYEFLGVC